MTERPYDVGEITRGIMMAGVIARFDTNETKANFMQNSFDIMVAACAATALALDKEPRELAENFVQSVPEGPDWQEKKHSLLATWSPYVEEGREYIWDEEGNIRRDGEEE